MSRRKSEKSPTSVTGEKAEPLNQLKRDLESLEQLHVMQSHMIRALKQQMAELLQNRGATSTPPPAQKF
jgi:hypothetical protein